LCSPRVVASRILKQSSGQCIPPLNK
jgi:hypothetical protein